MKKSQSRFLVRWFVSAFGLWVAAGLLGNESISFEGKVSAIILSGLILAIVNTIIKPLVVFMTLPAVLLSLGVFMVVINALMVLLAARLYGPLQVDGFGVAIIAGLVIGLVNWLVSAFLEENK
ncbi:phage holin family protein [Candidatus Saccharibacteria bacterium]|nr:phage holin family protein [Candidatus Saccharibacteria bacterium]